MNTHGSKNDFDSRPEWPSQKADVQSLTSAVYFLCVSNETISRLLVSSLSCTERFTMDVLELTLQSFILISQHSLRIQT